MDRFGHDELRRKFLIRLLEASGAVTAASLFPGTVFAAEAAAVVKGVRMSKDKDATRVVFDLTGDPDHHLFVLHNPNRVVIDFSRSAVKDSLDLFALPNSMVKGIRYAPRNVNDLRVVLDLRQAAQPSSFLIKPTAGNPDYRLVVDLKQTDASHPEPVMTMDHIDRELRDVVVAIDPGHGGKDPGAVGKHGTYEKSVVLDMGRRLHHRLNREKGIRTFMTRDRDVFLPLRERVRIARQQKADMFISIHADASTDRRVRGSSVYILSEHGASSEMARRLADRENNADLVGGVNLSDKDQMLASVLLDLSQTATIEASTDLADDVLDHLDRVGRIFSNRVERAGFVVLKSPDIPSVLVETAFISNPREERLLRTRGFQDKIVHALHNGIHNYFKENAPPGTLLAALNRKQNVG